jgi:hypothetical protein
MGFAGAQRIRRRKILRAITAHHGDQRVCIDRLMQIKAPAIQRRSLPISSWIPSMY